MLLGEDFGRRHKGRLMAVLDRAEARRRRDHRLAASDVSLHEPVHGAAGREVPQNIVDGLLLRAGEGEGEKTVKRLHMARVHGFGMQLVPLCADGGEACGKDEKFLEDEPPARFLQSLKRRGKVHRLVGKARGAKTIAGLYGFGQNVRKSIQARVERLPDARADELVGDAGGERVNGKNPARHNASHVDWLKGGVLHLMAVAFAERAIEAVALAVVELVFYIGLVEKHEVDRPFHPLRGPLRAPCPCGCETAAVAR